MVMLMVLGQMALSLLKERLNRLYYLQMITKISQHNLRKKQEDLLKSHSKTNCWMNKNNT